VYGKVLTELRKFLRWLALKARWNTLCKLPANTKEKLGQIS
jgi:hypothetical protein